MACDAILGIDKDCLNNIGGIQSVYIADREDITDVTETTGEVTAITMESTTQFNKFHFTKNSSSATETLEVDVTNGSTVYNQEVNIMIPRREVSKRNAIALLAAGQRDLTIIVVDNNGEAWLFGYNKDFEQGLVLTSDDGGTGAGKTDMNGYNLVFSNEMVERAFAVDKTIIPALLDPAV